MGYSLTPAPWADIFNELLGHDTSILGLAAHIQAPDETL
ncbi:hypothetical protein SBA2_680030 [Acidobacteriia bacterium SbA2]|nr:hypothetical protein SBA2_680030 [Acidobacteriia bacterium SbA2]